MGKVLIISWGKVGESWGKVGLSWGKDLDEEAKVEEKVGAGEKWTLDVFPQ
jgi:hypothetical protein